MNELNFQTLVVEGIEQKDNRIVIKSAGLSFSFFKLKKDGTESRAFQDFTKLGVQIGQTYSFGVSETQGQNPVNGQEITYRNIAVISEDRGQQQQTYQQNTPQQTSQPQVSTTPQSTTQSNNSPEPEYHHPEAPINSSISNEALAKVNENFSKLIAKIQDLEKRVEGIETYIHQEREDGKAGLDLHQSFDASKAGSLKENDIPIIDVDDDINIEDVPF